MRWRERKRSTVRRVDVIPQAAFLGCLGELVERVDRSGRGCAGDTDHAAGLVPGGSVLRDRRAQRVDPDAEPRVRVDPAEVVPADSEDVHPFDQREVALLGPQERPSSCPGWATGGRRAGS